MLLRSDFQERTRSSHLLYTSARTFDPRIFSHMWQLTSSHLKQPTSKKGDSVSWLLATSNCELENVVKYHPLEDMTNAILTVKWFVVVYLIYRTIVDWSLSKDLFCFIEMDEWRTNNRVLLEPYPRIFCSQLSATTFCNWTSLLSLRKSTATCWSRSIEESQCTTAVLRKTQNAWTWN